MKKIPYGMSNFRSLIEEDYLYIDKTPFIEALEENYRFLSFLRPRRFGKSLLVSTLQYYYDEYYADIWENLFKNTYIGKNPTKFKSSYRILFLEFSGISTTDIFTIERDFTNKLSSLLREYLEKYNYPEEKSEFLFGIKNSEALISEFFKIVKNDRIYILIDEYDNFANAILGENMETFKQILKKGGFVRSFYEVIKTATMSGVAQRVFITGVTPITMDTMTSGFNIIKDITRDKKFNELAGFNPDETKEVLTYLSERCHDINEEKLIKDMISLYNGYKFNLQAENKIFNSTMVMYFVLNFDTDLCEYPKELLDYNVASDYKKIMQLFSIGNTDDNYKVLQELIETNKTKAVLKGRFDFDKDFDRNDFVTLLYSLGFITINDEIFSLTEFIIPNYTIKGLYFDYFRVEIENRGQIKFDMIKQQNAIIELAMNRNTELLQNEIQEVIQLLSNRDFMKFDEKYLKIITLMILNISKFYYIKSEPEYIPTPQSRSISASYPSQEGNYQINGLFNKPFYPDIMLLKQEPFKTKYQFLFELKWVKRGSRSNATTVTDVALQHRPYKEWEEKKKEGIEQIKGYINLPDIIEIQKVLPLYSYLIIADGKKVEIVEVKK